MARRPLLTDEERRLLFGIPDDPDILAPHYTFTRSDQDLVAGCRGDANRLGLPYSWRGQWKRDPHDRALVPAD
jgi:Domain of unknown function (DUF4158)